MVCGLGLGLGFSLDLGLGSGLGFRVERLGCRVEGGALRV